MTQPDPQRELIGVGMVADNGGGPMLSLGPVPAIHPPFAMGPPVIGWEWARIAHEQDRGTWWGEYAVIGTWDGAAFTLTRPPVPLAEYAGPPVPGHEEDELSTPCPEPEDGWVPPDPERANDEALERAVDLADRLHDIGRIWIDQRSDPAADEDTDEALEGMDDAQRLVLNLRVAGTDARLAEVARSIRRVWGGSLCVSQAVRSRSALRGVQRELESRYEELEVYSVGASDGRVELEVLFDDGTLQRDLDEQHGAGVVRVSSLLAPLRE